jgi:hypothetical protein
MKRVTYHVLLTLTMESLQARLDSFKKSERIKNPNKPSSMKTLKSPHSSKFKVDPESLAEAGFFYDPSYDDPDNVTCFRCEKQLGGWEADNPEFSLPNPDCLKILSRVQIV